MSEILNNSIKVIVSFFIVLFINKALSIFRKRQLYFSCWNYLKNTSLSDNSCTINGSIYNKGKDKEKNVEISMPSGIKMSLVSSDYSSIKTENGKIIIDRILPKQKISIVALIEGVTEIDKKLKPEIKSEDSNGKTFLSQDVVPPSMGLIVLGMTGVLFLSGAILYIEAVDKNAIFYFEKKYNQIKYDELYEQGFSLAIYQKKEGVDRFTLKNSILPVKLLDISKTHEGISYTFDLYNPTNENVNVSAYFVVDDHTGYSNELKGLNKKLPQDKSKLKSDEWDEYLKNLKLIYDKYNVEYSLQKVGKIQIPITGSNNILIIKPGAHETLKIKRKISKPFKPNEYNMMLDFSIDRDEKDGYLDLIFNPSNSHKKNKFEEIQQNNN
ncbi:hypothetical protein [Pectobacterium odoriferum]|uniref:hypothetical protein n=1 Tax=Pectobacterium odoriferum TaxID=78398 RepID=UPI0011AF1F89|nr:hypothetical protein [Pectobacterium odoriferum]